MAPRRMAPERRRAQLVEAALELYGRHAPEQVSVDDVTRAADVSRALFYRYFSSLHELHVAALGAVVEAMLRRLALPAEGPLPERLRAALAVFLDVAEQHAAAYVALLRAGSVISTGETGALVDEVREHIVGLLRERGDVPDGPLVLMTLRGWVALVEGAVLTWLQERTVPRETLLDWLAGQMVGALAVTARFADG